ncbi:hypothetical protein [Sphingomonas psychrotolerans]|uniref:Uncharacterized protein n=1 Tax=Sphingomonas psychrotolerans TaxID=1327635 RepID=A0A2K8MQ27_9SPHN|nr:hypothetical protein [Sphingomonas psychrotolerans]ATY34089.1 hypothetical protein CVN68_20785 [Sphingomonas psychrotolerans]
MGKDREIVRSAPPEPQGPLFTPQRAAARLQIGERFAATAEVEVTPAGLLAIGGMVAAILLGGAILARAAKR